MKKKMKMMMFMDDHKEECSSSSTPKLPLFSFPMMNRAAESPWLATPPVNIAGTVPFLWEEAPGKPRACGGEDVTTSKVSCQQKKKKKKRNDVVRRRLELPPRLSVPAETAENEPSPTTVLGGPYAVSLWSEPMKKEGVKPAKEKGLLVSKRWGSSGKIKDVFEGRFDISRPTAAHYIGDEGGCGGWNVKRSKARRRRSLLNLNLSYFKSHFWERVYEGFKQVIPWRRRQENLKRMSSSTI